MVDEIFKKFKFCRTGSRIIIKKVDGLHDGLPKKHRGPVSVVFVLLLCAFPIISGIILFYPRNSQAKFETGQTLQIQPYANQADINTKPGDDVCYTGWSDFDANQWEGLGTKFENVNGVFSPADKIKNIDSVAFFNKPCKGKIVASFIFTPISSTLINLNIYHGNWYRWEIGGNDLRSVRLYKNLDGCNAFKDAVLVPTENIFLENGDFIQTGASVTATLSAYLTTTGKSRTVLSLDYISGKDGLSKRVSSRFFYDFDVSWRCDKKHVLNMENDFLRIGVGLMGSKTTTDEIPMVKLDRFKISRD